MSLCHGVFNRGVFINRYSGKKTSVNLKLPLFRPVRFAALEKTAGVSRFALVWKAMRRVLAMPHCHPHGPPKPYWPRMAWSFAQRTDLFVSFPCCAAWFQPRRDNWNALRPKASQHKLQILCLVTWHQMLPESTGAKRGGKSEEKTGVEGSGGHRWITVDPFQSMHCHYQSILQDV